MQDVRLGMVEARFADMIWDNAPLTTKELVAMCEQQLNWKRTTTYTVLKKLCDRGIFAMKDRVVTTVISREKFRAMQSQQFVEQIFGGSLPAFLASFASRKPLTAEELAQIKQLMEQLEEPK